MSGTDLIDRINSLSSAEDIFTLLGVDYDPEVVHVSRLHIMKRFGSYLRELDTDRDEEAVLADCRELLAKAHSDFQTSTPLKEKVFKVFRDEEEKQKARFVGLDTLAVIKR